MSTASVKRVVIAAESTYASISSSTGLPVRPSGVGVAFERASVDVQGGASELVERGVPTRGAFAQPPEVSTMFSGGARQRRQTGDVTLRMRVHGYGAGAVGGTPADIMATPLALILRTVMGSAAPGSALPAIAAGPVANAGVVEFDSPPGLVAGEVVLALVDGCVVANRVTDVAGNVATFLHYWPRQIITGDKLVRGAQFFVGVDGTLGTHGPSVYVGLYTLDTITDCYGCRLSSITFAPEGGQLFADVTLRAAIIQPDIDTAGTVVLPAPAPVYLAPTCTLRGSALLRTNGDTGPLAGTSAPLSLASAEMPYQLDGWSLALTFELVPIGTGCGLAGEQGVEVGSWSVTYGYTRHITRTDDEDDLLNAVSRGLALAAGPITSGSNDHNGWGCSIPAACLTADPNVSAPDGSLLQQALAYRAADYAGDTGLSRTVAIFLGGEP